MYRTANVLNKAPKSVQLALKAGLREIHGVLTRAAAEAAVDIFAENYGAKCAKAAEWLTKDRDALPSTTLQLSTGTTCGRRAR